MKKLLILLLAISVVLCLAACGSDDTEDSEVTSSQGSTPSTPSKDTTSESSSSKDNSSTSEVSEPSTESSTTEEPSEESSTPEESSSTDDPVLEWEVAPTISQYVGWKGSIGDGTGLTGVRATDATSLPLTAINASPVDGTASVIAFNYEYGRTIESDDGSYDDYNILVFTYDHDIFGYALTSSLGVDGEGKDKVEIPDDGYVLAVHKNWQAKVDAMLAADEGTVFFPHGFRATDALDASIKSGSATIDGKVSESEYGKPIWEIDPYYELANYEQFDSPLDVDVTAKVYMMYDAEYLYIGVVVDSPNHYLPNKDSLWRYDSIQVNVISVDPMDEYITGSSMWDFIINTQSSSDNVFRQYGFGVTNDGESVAVKYMGQAEMKAETVCYRDAANQTTTYEAKIPLSECGKEGETIKGEKGTVIGVSVSVNQGTEEKWTNVMLRDGGGIIGLNDITKVPTITFN
ncbi:MAG: hypothetical protein J1E00_06330 [Oscillospiraceae bacterium]|nr:hypothetical protein [Oscillospiraceae bacterium]